MQPVLLTIDPSINNLGFACCDFAKDPHDIGNWIYGVVHPKGKYIQHKWQDAYRQIRYRLEGLDPTHYACEWPTYFASQRGRIAAQENYTVDLASLDAYLAAKFQIRCEHICLWTAMQWKGTVSKEVTTQKFIRVFGEPARKVAARVSNDVIDAIMIGEFWMNIYVARKFAWQYRTD